MSDAKITSQLGLRQISALLLRNKQAVAHEAKNISENSHICVF